MNCPVCNRSEDFTSTHDPEAQEPDEQWCDYCGWHWQQTGKNSTPSTEQINSYRNDVFVRSEGLINAIYKAVSEEA